MNDPRELDDFIRKKLSEREPAAFDPAYWAAAEALIAAEAPRRRRVAWWWWLTGGLCLLLPLALWGLWSPASGADPAAPSAGLHMRPLPPVTQLPARVTPLPAAAETPRKAQPAPARPSRPATQAHLGAGQSTPTGASSLPTRAVTSLDAARSAAHGDRPRAAWRGLDSMPVEAYLLVTGGKGLPQQRSALRLDGRWRRHTLFAEGGALLAPGWGEAGAAFPASSPLLGLGYSLGLSSHLRLRTGLRYSARGGLDSDSTYRRTRYAFGFETEATRIDPQRLHTLAVPLTLEWRVRGTHYVHLGLEQAWLLNASARVTTQTLNEAGVTPTGSRRAWGYRQGFRRWNPALTLGYSRYLGQGLHLGMQARYGWRDLSDPAFFQNNRLDRDLQLRLILTYDIFNF